MPNSQEYDQRYFAGYEDMWLNELDEPALPDDIIYMRGWHDAKAELEEVNP